MRNLPRYHFKGSKESVFSIQPRKFSIDLHPYTMCASITEINQGIAFDLLQVLILHLTSNLTQSIKSPFNAPKHSTPT